MTKIKNKPSAPKKELIFRIKQGHFGLRIKGKMSQTLKKSLISHAQYWSAYKIEEYFEVREQKVNARSLQGWYYTQDAVNQLINQGHKVYIN